MVSSFIYRCYTLLDLPYVVTGGLLFYPWCLLSFFFSPTVLRAPLTDRPETLPPDRNLRVFYDARPKIGGGPPQKNWGPKTCKIFVDFGPLQTLIANISGTGQHIQNRPTLQTMAIPAAFDDKKPGELWSTNGLEFHVSLDPLKCTFLADYISALRGYCARKILHALEIGQALIAHTRSGTGVPRKNFNRENVKLGLKFSV